MSPVTEAASGSPKQCNESTTDRGSSGGGTATVAVVAAALENTAAEAPATELVLGSQTQEDFTGRGSSGGSSGAGTPAVETAVNSTAAIAAGVGPKVRSRQSNAGQWSNGAGSGGGSHSRKRTRQSNGGGKRKTRKSARLTTSRNGGEYFGMCTPNNCHTKLQDPAKPVMPSNRLRSNTANTEGKYNFNTVWAQLKKYGWYHMSAGSINKLHDWYYCRPGVIPGKNGAKLGEHYFMSEEEVVAQVRKWDIKDNIEDMLIIQQRISSWTP